MAPIKVSNMEWDHNGACEQETHEVSEHQSPEEDQKEGARAALRPLEGLEENYKGDEIRGEAQDHEDRWVVGWGDGEGEVEWRAVLGEAEWGVVGERQDWGIHGGQRVQGRWLQIIQRCSHSSSQGDVMSLFNLEVKRKVK